MTKISSNYVVFFRHCYRSIKILMQVSKRKEKNQSIIDLFYEVLEKYPDKVCFYFENSKITFKEVNCKR